MHFKFTWANVIRLAEWQNQYYVIVYGSDCLFNGLCQKMPMLFVACDLKFLSRSYSDRTIYFPARYTHAIPVGTQGTCPAIFCDDFSYFADFPVVDIPEGGIIFVYRDEAIESFSCLEIVREGECLRCFSRCLIQQAFAGVYDEIVFTKHDGGGCAVEFIKRQIDINGQPSFPFENVVARKEVSHAFTSQRPIGRMPLARSTGSIWHAIGNERDGFSVNMP